MTAFDPNAPALAGSGIYGLPHSAEDARVVLVPVPFDATTSYGKGAADGPSAILHASRQVDLFDLDTGRPYEAGIHLLDEPPVIRQLNEDARALAAKVIAVGGEIAGDASLQGALDACNAICARVDDQVYARVKEWLDAGKIVGTIGGDHATPFGAIRAHAERFPGMGILHFDAHSDLRPAYEGFTCSHASIMYNVTRELAGVAKLVQVGIRDLSEEEHGLIRESGGRIRAFFDPEVRRALRRGESFAAIAERIAAELPREVYVSFDIDGLDPALCPHTGTPVPGGLSFHEVAGILDAILDTGRRIVGFDLDEVAPDPGGSEWDANVGARILYKLIGYTLLSQGIGSRPA